jgi:hypothetical protein
MPKPKEFCIKVLERDIQRGQQTDSNSCAIARAFRRHFHTTDVDINGSEDIRIGDHVYYAPACIDTFIAKFDNGKPVKPFRFKLTRIG